MVTDIDLVKTETFVDTLVGMYRHWVARCLRWRGERRRAVLAVDAYSASASVSSAAVAAARVVPPAERQAALWDHAVTQPRCAWTPTRPALQQGVADHLSYPGGAGHRPGLSPQAPAHLYERCSPPNTRAAGSPRLSQPLQG